MKPLDIFSLKKLLWQNFDNELLTQLYNELGIDEQKVSNKGLIVRANNLVDQIIKAGRVKDLIDEIKKLKPEILKGVFYFDENLFLPQETLLKDSSLISVPLDQVGERIVQPQAEDPKANALLKSIGELSGRLEVLADPVSQETLFTKLEEASQIVRSNWTEDEYWKQLGRAEFLIRTVSSEIYRLEKQRELRIAEENSRIEADKRIRQDEVSLTWTIPLIILFYAALVISAAAISIHNGYEDFLVPLLNIPLSVLIWASIGSLSAILYRYYKRIKKASIIPEIRLTFGRFWIGLVSGAIFYFAIRSGLFIISNREVDLNASPLGQQQFVWVLVWLISFSDFAFERIITRITGNVIGEESEKTVSSIFGVSLSDISDAIERSSLRQLSEWRRLRAEIKADIANEIKGTKEVTNSEQPNPQRTESKVSVVDKTDEAT